MLLAVPSLLVVSPLVGFFVGKFVDRWLQSSPAWSIVGLALGFVAAGREIYLIIRRVQAEEEGDKRP
jgi:F0F1-type ATP synthase assembly protein I